MLTSQGEVHQDKEGKRTDRHTPGEGRVGSGLAVWCWQYCCVTTAASSPPAVTGRRSSNEESQMAPTGQVQVARWRTLNGSRAGGCQGSMTSDRKM